MASRVTAEERAEVLLRKYLTPEQLADFDRTRAFNVMGSDGRRYRITGQSIYHVVTEGGTGLCAVPVDYLPIPDTMLATKVLLETDAKRFLFVANKKPHAYMHQRPRGYPQRPLLGWWALPAVKFTGVVGLAGVGTLVVHLSGLV